MARLAAQDTISLRPGMVITRSVTVAAGTYALPGSADPDEAILTIRGSDITVNLAGVRLEGTPITADPDQARGIAIHIDGGRNVTVRGATIRGYKIAILATGTHKLTLADNELSHSWKARLFSLVGHESLVDWMSFHNNEAREWMRFGAAIYLEDVRGGTIAGNRATQGMNGLLMVRSDSLVIRDNAFAFNSALGIGLYRSSGNVIVRNRVDFNVRGYSHGFYRRGQDSAGILMYEQSSHNVVAWNSVTHGGDGLFLWAGPHTMDTGEGGANDNLFVANDFSFAPTNGMEATFSSNRFIGNRVEGNDHGLWGGYSWESEVAGNCFIRNRIGIAIEHGQENTIRGNTFFDDSTVIRLWGNPVEPSDWGYPKHRDTRSRDYVITGNRFVMNPRIWNVEQTTQVDTTGNVVQRLAMSDDCTTATPADSDLARARAVLPDSSYGIPVVPMARFDRSAIIVDEWGPFDWQSPKLSPIDTTRAIVPLRTVGPVGRWHVVSRRGVRSVSAESGRMGDTIVVMPTPPQAGGEDWMVELEYTGGETVWPNGERVGAGTPVRFAYSRFEPAVRWDVRFFAWSDSTRDPMRDSTAFAALLRGAPLLTREEPRLDYMWYRPVIAGLPQERWALEATGTVTLGASEYSLRTISDDAIRVWVDGALVIDRWEPHESAVSYAAIGPGRHELRVQYYQVGGWSEVRVEIVRGSARSVGSAGPH
jgi:nitrous oxidase accessory protein NosD